TAGVAPRAGAASGRASVIAMSISNFRHWIRSTASAPHCQSRSIGAEQCPGLLAERGAVLVAIWFGPTGDGDRRDEAVAAPGDVYDEPVTIAPIAQCATQGGHMDRKVGRLNKYVRPNPSHQFLLADQLTWTFKQHGENFQSTTSERYCLVAFQKKKLR